MPRVTIDESARPMAKRLARLIGTNRFEAMGYLEAIWHDSQAAELVLCNEHDLYDWLHDDIDAAILIQALVDCGFLKPAGDGGYEIIGNQKHINGIRAKREGGRDGGKRGGRPKVSKEPLSDTHKGYESEPTTKPQYSTVQYSTVQSNSAQDSSVQHRKEKTGSSPSGQKKTRTPPASGPTWDAYSGAFRKRYGHDPARNATVNSQLAAFVKRLGTEHAPAVAEFYVGSAAAFYAMKRHSVGPMLADAEKLYSEWKTGTRTTAVGARQGEQADHYRDQLARIDRGEL